MKPHSEELRALFTIAYTNAARMFEAQGEILPMWHAVPKDGPHLLIATPWSGDDEKEIGIAFLREKFAELDVQRYAFIVEAWTVTGGDPRTILNERPSRHPDRREVVRIQAEDKAGNTLSGQYFILRPEHGPAKLSPFHEDPPDMIQAGRMAGMLTPTTGGSH